MIKIGNSNQKLNFGQTLIKSFGQTLIINRFFRSKELEMIKSIFFKLQCFVKNRNFGRI